MNEQTEGAVVEQEPKEPKFCEVEYDLDESKVLFGFKDGTTLEIAAAQLNDDMKQRAMLHGLNQKIRDSFAGVKGDVAKGIENAKGVIEALLAGNWRQARGEGEAKPRIGELAEAISRLKAIDIETATKAVTEADDAKRKEWRAHPRIKAAIAAIRAEKAQAELAKAGEVADITL
jgi:hypothetical protein